MERIVFYLAPLRTVARDHGYEELFESLVDPWVNHHASGGNPSEKRTGSTTSSAVALTPHQSTNDLVMNTLNGISITMTDLASSAKRLASFAEHQAEARAVKTPERPDLSSSPTARPTRRESDSGDVGPLEDPPAEAGVGEAHDQGVAVPPYPPRELQDLLCGELPEDPWQHRRYPPDNQVWLSAAMRRRTHYRRSNVSLGVCTVDRSGPHEPSPRPGKQIHRDTVSYFLVFTIRPDQPLSTVEAVARTEEEPGEEAAGPPVAAPDAQGPEIELRQPLIYCTQPCLDRGRRRRRRSRDCWPRSTTITPVSRTPSTSGCTATVERSSSTAASTPSIRQPLREVIPTPMRRRSGPSAA